MHEIKMKLASATSVAQSNHLPISWPHFPVVGCFLKDVAMTLGKRFSRNQQSARCRWYAQQLANCSSCTVVIRCVMARGSMSEILGGGGGGGEVETKLWVRSHWVRSITGQATGMNVQINYRKYAWSIQLTARCDTKRLWHAYTQLLVSSKDSTLSLAKGVAWVLRQDYIYIARVIECYITMNAPVVQNARR